MREFRAQQLTVAAIPFAKAMAKKFRNNLDYCEAESVAFFALFKAATRFDPDHPSGASFTTFAYEPVKWAVIRARNNRKIHESLDYDVADTQLAQPTIPDEILGCLKDNDKEVLIRYFVLGESSTEIAKIFGVSDSQIRKTIAQCKANIQSTWIWKDGEWRRRAKETRAQYIQRITDAFDELRK
jgi:RNA polymerase sigma factor (sigma-70 family)